MKNSRKDSFINALPQISIEDDNNNLASRCKFNLSYFDKQDKSQSFSEWPNNKIIKLTEKLIELSKSSLEYWENQGILTIYGSFPSNSLLSHPKHVPHQAVWGRFRLEGRARLAGFMIPKEKDGSIQNEKSWRFCKNTFYIVFLDADHNFYPVKK